MLTATDLLAWGAVAHLVADFLLQNAWMAEHKTSLRHPAASVHSGIQLAGAALVFPLPVAVALGVAHLLIDTRRPLQCWQRLIGQTREGPAALLVAIAADQVLHLGCLAAASLWSAR